MEKVKSMFTEKNFQYWGLSGTIFMVIALFIPQIGYKGLQNESYSMLNHFVSELGQLGVSHLAIVFNAGIFIGGLLYIPFMIGFGNLIGNKIAKIGIIIGIITALSGSLVGIFPMNYLIQHVIFAMGFFYSGMITIIFFTVGILIQKEPKISRYLSIVGFVVIIIFAIFLSTGFGGQNLQMGNGQSVTDYLATFNRPEIFMMAILEWAAVLSIVIYLAFFAIYFTIRNLKK